MVDAFCMLVIIAFSGVLIYSTVIHAPKKAVPRPVSIPPSPIGLFCSICQAPSGMVSHDEYMRISEGGRQIHCGQCLIVIEAYKHQQASHR
jgi:hypothetical protein